MLPFHKEYPVFQFAVKIIATIEIYKSVILPVILYECDIWSVTLKEEYWPRVFENILLRKIYGHKRDEVTEEWRRVNSEELHNFLSLPNFVLAINSRRLRWADCIAHMEKKEMYTGFWWRNLRTRDYLENLGIYGRIILKCILKNRMWAWAGLIWLRIRTDGVLFRTR